MIITPVVTETRGPKTQDIYKRTEAHHPEPAHALSMQFTNASTNITPPHTVTPNKYIYHHTLLQDVWKLYTIKVKKRLLRYGYMSLTSLKTS